MPTSLSQSELILPHPAQLYRVGTNKGRHLPLVWLKLGNIHTLSTQLVLLCWLVLHPCVVPAQAEGNQSPFWQPDSQANRKRQQLAWYGIGGGAMVTYGYLGTVWYGGQGTTQFRWFDDSDEWLQLDKVGHAYGAYQESRLAMDLMKWAGAPRKTVLLAGLTGFVLQTPIEILDGISPEYGASWTDIAANAAGSGLAVLNEALWREQIVMLKFSYSPSSYAAQRPDLLGNGAEELIKDYNGQTYWLTISPDPLLPEGRLKDIWPNWLGFAVGYGGRGMIGGYGQEPRELIRAREQREYYLSLDIDLSRIRTRRPGFLRTLLHVANSIRVPLPAYRFGPAGGRFYPIFY